MKTKWKHYTDIDWESFDSGPIQYYAGKDRLAHKNWKWVYYAVIGIESGLIVIHQAVNGGKYYKLDSALLEWLQEFAPKHEVGRYEFSANMRIAFLRENDAFAFKMRWHP